MATPRPEKPVPTIAMRWCSTAPRLTERARPAHRPKGESGSSEQLGERATAEDRAGMFGDDVGVGLRVLVAALDQEPLRLCARACALQREAAAQLLSVEHEHGVATGERLWPGDASTLLV